MPRCHQLSAWCRRVVVGIIFATAFTRLDACTIFVLVDEQRVLFCNNEDWENPNVRIWFVPADARRLGCAYVGFDNGWGQGGMNTAGLAYDWVAGFKEQWERAEQKSVAGNPAERMLERCTTVDEAFRFFEQHWEPSFSYAKILVADRTGTSAVIQAKAGKLTMVRARDCRGFGFNGARVMKMLETTREPTVITAGNILRATTQEGRYGTKYSNVYDLRSGDIFIFHPPESSAPVKLNLTEELRKGEHYYDLPALATQLTQPPRALPWRKPWWTFWR
jgi:hypothetical protein